MIKKGVNKSFKNDKKYLHIITKIYNTRKFKEWGTINNQKRKVYENRPLNYKTKVTLKSEEVYAMHQIRV